RLSKDITTVFALVWMSFRFTGLVAGGSVSRVGRVAAFCGAAWFGADPGAGAAPGVGRTGWGDGAVLRGGVSGPWRRGACTGSVCAREEGATASEAASGSREAQRT